MRILILLAAGLTLAACEKPDTGPVVEETAETATPTASEARAADPADELAAILAAQDDEAQARFGARNPAETLEFFGVKPGMRVIEALPGGGWYTKILAPYIGSEGALYGVDYAPAMWSEFDFATPEFIEGKAAWPTEWPVTAAAYAPNGAPETGAFTFGAPPEELAGTFDAVLMIRALHNLSRFEAKGGYLTTAVDNTWEMLKPGGIVGIVQHRAPADWPAAATDGSQGYLSAAAVQAKLEERGFVLEASSEINANAKDQPAPGEIVWRLPPTLATSAEDEELRAQLIAVGETDRMTLRFRKPAAE